MHTTVVLMLTAIRCALVAKSDLCTLSHAFSALDIIKVSKPETEWLISTRIQWNSAKHHFAIFDHSADLMTKREVRRPAGVHSDGSGVLPWASQSAHVTIKANWPLRAVRRMAAARQSLFELCLDHGWMDMLETSPQSYPTHIVLFSTLVCDIESDRSIPSRSAFTECACDEAPHLVDLPEAPIQEYPEMRPIHNRLKPFRRNASKCGGDSCSTHSVLFCVLGCDVCD
jgi:hypothetical protein